MKISKSKKELARIISKNGGWRDGAEWAALEHQGGDVWLCAIKPLWCAGVGIFSFKDHVKTIPGSYKLPNIHQAILSRAEYFHLYPAPDTDGWIEWNGGMFAPVIGSEVVDVMYANGAIGFEVRCDSVVWEHKKTPMDYTKVVAYRLHKPEQASAAEILSDEAVSVAKDALMSDSIEGLVRKPTIEQLASDYRNAKNYAERKQQEADAARDDADAKLKALELAGEALGLLVSPIAAKHEPELVITDWRDLRIGDEVECLQINIIGDDYADERIGTIGLVSATEEPGRSGQAVKLKFNDDEYFWVSGWRFIRRP